MIQYKEGLGELQAEAGQLFQRHGVDGHYHWLQQIDRDSEDGLGC